MKTRAGSTTGRAEAGVAASELITGAFAEGIRAAIPPAEGETPPAAPTRRCPIAKAFAEGIRAAIPAEGEEGTEGRGGGREEPGRDGRRRG